MLFDLAGSTDFDVLPPTKNNWTALTRYCIKNRPVSYSDLSHYPRSQAPATQRALSHLILPGHKATIGQPFFR